MCELQFNTVTNHMTTYPLTGYYQVLLTLGIFNSVEFILLYSSEFWFMERAGHLLAPDE